MPLPLLNTFGKQGLSNNTVLCIRQDREGFIWMGTRDGLNKYDGYAFTTYKPDPLDPAHTWGHNWVNNISRRPAGKALGNHPRGRFAPDGQTHRKLTSYRIDPTRSTTATCAAPICEDRQGTLWIASHGGLMP
jgi:ligand-binding sensor domain-containing protein